MYSWGCVQAVCRKEGYAEANLSDLGYEVCLPKYRLQIRHARRCDQVIRPLFPGYLFVRQTTRSLALAVVRRTPGVVRLLGDSLTGSPILDVFISEMRAREKAQGLVELGADRFARGQRVRILAGPFAGFEAIFDEADDRKRTIILIEFLGKINRVAVDPQILEVAI